MTTPSTSKKEEESLQKITSFVQQQANSQEWEWNISSLSEETKVVPEIEILSKYGYSFPLIQIPEIGKLVMEIGRNEKTGLLQCICNIQKFKHARYVLSVSMQSSKEPEDKVEVENELPFGFILPSKFQEACALTKTRIDVEDISKLMPYKMKVKLLCQYVENTMGDLPKKQK